MLQSPSFKTVFKIEIFDFKIEALIGDPYLYNLKDIESIETYEGFPS